MKKFVFILCVAAFAGVLISTVVAQPIEHISVSIPTMHIPQDFNDDGKMPIKMRLRYRPATADVSAVQWISSDPSVATVDNEGNVTLLKHGETAISAKLGGVSTTDDFRMDNSQIGWAQCLLTVTLAENRSLANRNLMSVLPIPDGEKRNRAEDFLRWPSEYGETVVALWPDNATAAFYSTSDDQSANRYAMKEWVRMQKTYAVPISYMADFPDAPHFFTPVQAHIDFINTGGEIQSHSMRHHSGEMDKWTTSDAIWDLGASRDHINAKLREHAASFDRPQRCQTFGHPGGKPAPAEYNKNRNDYVRKFYTAVRGYGSHTASDYMFAGRAARHYTILAEPGKVSLEANMRALIEPGFATDTVPNHGGLGFHGSHGPQGLHMDFVCENFVVPNRPWIVPLTFTDFTCYAQQRDASEIKDKTVAPNRIEFTVTDYLDDELFDRPLTIKVRLDNLWNKLTATQDGKPVESRLVKNGGHVYAFVKAVPDRGRVVLNKAGAEKKYSGNANLAALEYRTDKELVFNDQPLPDRHPVPDFTPDKTEYTVTLPPGTPMAAIYATPADPAATALRNPTMGIVRFTTAPDGAELSSSVQRVHAPATVTVTAEDETVKTYTIHFVHEAFADITALSIDTPVNLAQTTDAQPVDFTAATQPADGTDPSTIQWYVNDEKQDTTGTTYRYTPLKYGTYTVQARAGKAQSEKRDIVFTKGAPKQKVVILDENFERHAAGKPVPVSDNPADNKFSATTPSIPTSWRTGEEGVKITELGGTPSFPPNGKVGKWTTLDNTWQSGLAKTFPASTTEPLVVVWKVRADNADPKGASLFTMHYLPVGQRPGHPIVAMVGNNQFANFLVGWPNGWDPKSQKWMSLAYVFDPSRRQHNKPTAIYEGFFIGNENFAGKTEGNNAVEFIAHTGYNARHSSRFSDTDDANVIFGFSEGPKNPADLGKYSTYLNDVQIYRPGSFVMIPAKESFAANEPVRMKFSHHANLQTLKPERVKVTDSKGVPVAVESLTTDFMNFDHFVINFANGALKKGETYTVALDESVRDVLDKTAYDVATFKVQ